MKKYFKRIIITLFILLPLSTYAQNLESSFNVWTSKTYDSSEFKPIFSMNWEHYAFVWSIWYVFQLIEDWKVIDKTWDDISKQNIETVCYLNNDLVYKRYYNNKAYMVINKKESQYYDYIIESACSENTARLAYVAVKNKKTILVLDWKEQNLDYENIRLLRFSPDWNGISFVWYKNEKSYVIMDWKQVWEFEIINDLKYYPDWKWLIISVHENWKHYVVRNWIKDNEYKAIWNIKISRFWDVFYNASDNLKKYIFKNWIEIQGCNIAISSDSKSVSCITDSDYWNDKKIYWTPYNYMYSTDWNSIAFNITKSNKVIIVKDWKEIDWWPFTYSPDWTNFLYFVLEKWKNFLVENWIKSKISVNSWMSNMKYSPDWNTIIISDRLWGQEKYIVFTRKNKIAPKKVDDIYITKPIKADEELVNKFKQKFNDSMKWKTMLDDEFEEYKSKLFSKIEKTKNKLNKDSVNYLTLEEIEKYLESTDVIEFLFN